VAVSFVSVANAEQNLDAEIPDWNFERVKSSTENSWNDYLTRIRVAGGTTAQQKMFYTALYHVALCPNIFNDVNGQYISVDGTTRTVEKGHNFYATFSMWDTYRTPPQLLALIAPNVCSDQIRSLLLMSQESAGGGLPGWSYYNSDPNVMGTYPAPIFIANGYAFGARDFDAAALKNKLVQCATQPGLKCSSASNGGCSWPELSTYKSLGHRPNKCSDNLELAITDFSISRYCLALGDSANYRYFLNRSQNIFKLINAEGWMQRKDASGNWVTPFSTTATEGFTEGNSAQYSWDIPFNIAELIKRMGGYAAFVSKLDDHLSQYVSGWPTKSPYWWIGNEPGFGVPFKYNWAQAPWRTQYHIRNAIDAKFTAKADGLPGNDDTGASSAWLAFAMMGIYPEIPGVGGFTLFSPSFERVTINLSNGKTFEISTKNQGTANRYIRRAKLNGRKYSRLWIDMETINTGAKLLFNLSQKPNTRWGSKTSDMPPSFKGTHDPI
jgi:predicted alpha-1,2-mannosidase